MEKNWGMQFIAERFGNAHPHGELQAGDLSVSEMPSLPARESRGSRGGKYFRMRQDVVYILDGLELQL